MADHKPQLTNAAKPATFEVEAYNERGEMVPTSIAGEHPLTIYVDKREVDLAALEPELKRVVATNPELAVSLQADEGVPYRAVAKVIANIQRSGVTKLSVLTQPGG